MTQEGLLSTLIHKEAALYLMHIPCLLIVPQY